MGHRGRSGTPRVARLMRHRGRSGTPRVAQLMRHRGRAGLPRVAIAVAAGVLLVLLGAGAALALDPTASPAGGGDVRTNSTAPGLVGDPLFAVLGVAVVGLAAVAVTLVAARLADRRPR